MQPHRLKAPSADGSLLAEPPLAQAPALLEANAARLADWDHDFQGRPASFLRPLVRRRVVALARDFLAASGFSPPPDLDPSGPLVVTGHQPELFHPGVWIKNFAVASIARQVGGLGLNLIVDNDIPKAASVKVPRRVGNALRLERVPFDDRAVEVPYEDLAVADEPLFDTFAARVREVLPADIADPILDLYWPAALRARASTDRAGLRFALARHAVEESWGIRNLEVPLSQVCETEGFHWFASHLLAHLPRFQQVHNDALARYRQTYGIRSKNHPVPALAAEGDWLEAPFWAWRDTAPRRRPLLARQRGRVLDIRIAGEPDPFATLPLSPDREACCAVEELAKLPAQGIRIRTRALTTTMFARYLLGDLFLHGIGGAKYDELGDEVSRGFFGIKPPDYLTLSLTLWLGLGDDPDASTRLKAHDRLLRDLAYSPERHLDAEPDASARQAIAEKRNALAGPVETHAQRLARFREIRRCNAALQHLVARRREATLAERADLQAAVRRNAVARSREYPAILHSGRRLRDAISDAIPDLDLAGK